MYSLFLIAVMSIFWRARVPSFRHFDPVIWKSWQLMCQFWPKIDQENSGSECMQHMIIPHMLVLRYIQCPMAKIVSRHTGQLFQIFFISSQLVIFNLEHDQIWWVDRNWLCPKMKICFKIHNKSLKQMWFDWMTWNAAVCHINGCAKKLQNIKRNCITYLNLEIQILRLSYCDVRHKILLEAESE